MLSGTAWSSAHRAEGGGFASSVPGVRDMQQAFGVMQAIHQEQKRQTVVLEEIRDGASSNPRRVLANQGIMWADDEFRQAIRRADLNSVSLFLQGGMLWSLPVVRDSLASSGIEKLEGVLDLLAQYPQQLEKPADRHAKSCWHLFQKISETPSLLESKGFKKIMNKHCSSEADAQQIRDVMEYAEQRYAEEIRAHEKSLKSLKTKDQCESELLSNDASAIRREVLDGSLTFPAGVYSLGPSDRTTMLIHVYEETKDSGGIIASKITKKFRNAIAEYCEKTSKPAPRPANTQVENYKKVFTWVQN